MKIVLWHGYLLGGTGSNVYTRALAREWSRAGHEVVVLSQEPHPEQYDLGGARHVRPEIGGVLPVFVLDRYEGARGAAPAGADARRARALRRAERRRVRARAPGRPRLRQPRPARRPGRRGERRALRGQGARLRARVLDARQRGAAGVGEGVARAAPRPSSSARSTSAQCSKRSSATSTTSTRFRPASTSTSSAREPRAEALAALLEEARRDPPNRRQRAPPGRGQRRAARRVPRRARSRRSSTSGSCSTTRASTCCSRLCASSTRARVIVGFGDYRERARAHGARRGRSSPARSSTATSSTCSRSADVTVVPSIFPEAFGMVAAEAAAAGSPPLVARHSGLDEIAEGLEAEYPPEYRAPDELRDRRRRRPHRQARASCSRSPRKRRRAPRERPRAVSRRAPSGAGGASPQLLQPFN